MKALSHVFGCPCPRRRLAISTSRLMSSFLRAACPPPQKKVPLTTNKKVVLVSVLPCFPLLSNISCPYIILPFQPKFTEVRKVLQQSHEPTIYNGLEAQFVPS